MILNSYYTVFINSYNEEVIAHHLITPNIGDILYNSMVLPKGSIRKLIGRKLTVNCKPVRLK